MKNSASEECHEISEEQGRVSQILLIWWLVIQIRAADWLKRSESHVGVCDWLKRRRNEGRWLVNINYFLAHDMPKDFCIFIGIALPIQFINSFFHPRLLHSTNALQIFEYIEMH